MLTLVSQLSSNLIALENISKLNFLHYLLDIKTNFTQKNLRDNFKLVCDALSLSLNSNILQTCCLHNLLNKNINQQISKFTKKYGADNLKPMLSCYNIPTFDIQIWMIYIFSDENYEEMINFVYSRDKITFFNDITEQIKNNNKPKIDWKLNTINDVLKYISFKDNNTQKNTL